MADRPYLFHELTSSLCTRCLRKVEAKVIEQQGRVYLDKLCLEHGRERVLIASDAEYWKRARRTIKPGQLPKRFNTSIERGCPWDCGLCPDHEQHSCLTLIEITDRCNLSCPVCYADSAPGKGSHRSLELIEQMLDAIVANEGEPDVVQISGGEPTIHPQFFEVLDAAKARPIKHLMLNTNGVRIANEDGFAERLAEYRKGFEIYLQWDSLEADPIRALRGADLLDTRHRALEKLNALDLSATLVVTLKRGLNDHEAGRIVDFASQQRCVRGVTFQPVQQAGRLEDFDPARDRLTLTDVRNAILEQSALFQPEDIVPVPCHPDCIAMAYALKTPVGVMPLTRFCDPQGLLDNATNTIIFERTPGMRDKILDLFSTSHSPASGTHSLQSLLCCLPKIELPVELNYGHLFRVIVMEFLDAWSFDVRSVKKTCVHIVHPDLRIIPFDTYNMFYRPGLKPVEALA